MPKFLDILSRYSQFILAAGIISIILVLLFPVPTGVLDILLAFSITTAVIILMTTLFISKPLELSAFPTILLVTTILRLSLNIASTRLILAEGHSGESAAGYIIRAFGHFVMQGNVVIGLIVFIILTIINFIVITKGSGRIAEVAARFSLDAMPGKQMAIDADLSAGLIDEATAKARRKELEDESTFYGSMDGANKFVRGDAIAGLLITFINLIGGIIIGVVQRDLDFSTAMQTYTILTIGEGLVSQIPSLIISLAAGLLVTKSGVAGPADKAIFGQLSRYPQSLYMTGIVTGLIALLPGLPFLPFFLLSSASLGTGYLIVHLQKNQSTTNSQYPLSNTGTTSQSSLDPNSPEGVNDDKVSEALQLDIIKVELGYNLLQLVNYSRGHKLTDQIKALRQQIAKDYGFIMPSVRLQDNLQLPSNLYVIKIKEIECGRGEIKVDKLLIIDPQGGNIDFPGENTIEPTFGLPAKWIDDNYREEALFNNLTVVDPPTIVTTHLTELIKENITELLSYSEVQKLLEELTEEHKKLVKDVVPDTVSISTLQKVLHTLLNEGISIRDLATILEATADAMQHSKTVTTIVEYVRSRLTRQICANLVNSEGYILAISLSSEWEEIFINNLSGESDDKYLTLPPSKIQEFINKVRKAYDDQAIQGHIPVLLTSGLIRPYVRAIIDRIRTSIGVVSQNEIHPRYKVRTVGLIS